MASPTIRLLLPSIAKIVLRRAIVLTLVFVVVLPIADLV
jgi:hypothetical protein